mgnify:CR=1 FL=1
MIMDSVLAQLLESPKMIEPDNEHIEQYLLAGATSELAFKADNGVVRSRAVAGFAAPVRVGCLMRGRIWRRWDGL